MNVINSQSALLCNFEVFQLMKDIQNGKNGFQKPGGEAKNLSIIAKETVSYLENTACKDQTAESIAELKKNLNQFKLTNAEKLQIVNLLPQSAVEVQLIVEECEERMSIEDIENLITVVNRFVAPNS
ncbi:hypothetical protein HELRODRAFT_171157 [Helobdella robusta]|uniref:DNA-directed RNA polymerase III subunit RPC9 n=1 Tax=Helobdella robusta TaxID=6412 RepID=T1F3V9_HELRO|nr:hypothetical protein HELRODRAFT_171157 [Helobdella robusta]ESO05519.1 hypothetical protein HELRODRAFT_171157 [Helobdella robusta]